NHWYRQCRTGNTAPDVPFGARQLSAASAVLARRSVLGSRAQIGSSVSMPCWRSRLSVLVRSPLVRVAERLQFALEVVPVDTVDGEARLLDDLGHPTCQMTPARERLPERFYPF